MSEIFLDNTSMLGTHLFVAPNGGTGDSSPDPFKALTGSLSV